MSKLQIYKASAGSGKTFRLTIEYLKIALFGDFNYKNILAVTFTNKATTEMKHRVVDELSRLADGQSTPYMEVLSSELSLSELEISAKAATTLKNILHDYSRFSISTIDSFFQRVIKAFNRELGINTSYQVDLEENLILEEAVDQLLLSVGEDKDLLEWLKQFAQDKIREGGGWNLKKDILSLADEIYKETFKKQNEPLYQKLNNKTFIKSYQKELQQIISIFENKLKQLGKQGLNVMQNAGLTVSEFKYGKSGPANAFNQLLKAELKIGKRIEEAISDESFFYKKNDIEAVKTTASKLQLLLFEAVEFYSKKLDEYNTARLISKQLYTLAILVDLQSIMRKLVREKGVILISESGNLLKEIISDAEAPFIYEKTGTYYSHFMIDEFQDTSGLQWGNFKPLVKNSLSEEKLGMLVGDVKQAIYRWRNGDWRLLGGTINDDFVLEGLDENVLNKNWRSDENVIRFNNSVFSSASSLLDQHFKNEVGDRFMETDSFPSIAAIYQDCVQEVGKSNADPKGFVQMRFLEKQTDVEHQGFVLDELIETIKSLQDNGANASEIAILVRKKEEAKIIATRLLDEKFAASEKYNFDVLSSESLYVKNSSVVQFVLGLLELQLLPGDELIQAFLSYSYHNDLVVRLRKVQQEPVFTSVDEQEQLAFHFKKGYQPDISEQFENPDHPDNEFLQYISSNEFIQTISTKNIQEAIFTICSTFNLFKIKEEQAYLQAFIDQVGSFTKSRINDIASFLNWWEEQGAKKTVAVSENIDAIRIQTIHKAKGLEYNYVLIPFGDWSLNVSAQHAPILWCKPTVEPFDQLELVPVKYEKSMADSYFKNEYFEEKLSGYIDNLNLLYVAFTRAKNALFTWSVYENGKMNSVGSLLFETASQSSEFDLNDGLLTFGNFSTSQEKAEIDTNAITMQEISFSNFRDFLHLRKRNEHFFNTDSDKKSPVNLGKLIHEVLAKIRVASDVDNVINDLVFSGVVSVEQSHSIRSQIDKMVSDPEVSSWFDGSYRILNERNILTGENGLKRPDRIMISDREVVVVDYKSGDLELDKYTYQVRSYIRFLKACGYENVSGFIWYTKTNKRERVEV